MSVREVLALLLDQNVPLAKVNTKVFAGLTLGEGVKSAAVGDFNLKCSSFKLAPKDAPEFQPVQILPGY